MDVRMPDGTVVQNVPEGITQEELLRRYNAGEQTMLDAQLRDLFGETAPPVERPDPTVGDYAKAGASMLSSAVTAPAGMALGTVEGLAESAAAGTFGTQAGAEAARATAFDRAGRYAYTPQSPGAQEVIRQTGELVEPLARYTDPLMGMAPAFSGVTNAATPYAASVLPSAVSMAERNAARPPLRAASAMASDPALERATAAGQMPVPMVGERAPTLGQLTREQQQLRLERELARNDDVGGPLRQRFDNQLEGLNQNLDAIEQQFPVRNVEDRAIGQATAQAVERRKADEYAKVRQAYDAAREAGEDQLPVALRDLDEVKLETQRLGSLAPNAAPIYKEAQRLGVLDGDGNPQSVPVGQLETLREFVNTATDLGDRRQSRIRRLWMGTIDSTIDAAPVGPKYRAARQRYASWANEFENTPLVRDMLREKRGTNERAVPFENVFQKTLLSGSVDEVNKLRGTLLRSDEGKQAWFDLKGRFARHIADQARTSNTASNDQPILSPYKLGKTIDELDRTGKLESVFGKSGAAEIRNIREMAASMLTVPPGTVNSSGTAAELFNMLMRVVPGGGRISNYVEKRNMRQDVQNAMDLSSRTDLYEQLTNPDSLIRNLRASDESRERVRMVADELRKRYQ